MTKFLTKQEVCDSLGVSIDTLESLIKRGDLRAYRIARRIRIAESDLESYLEGTRWVARPGTTTTA